MLWPDPGARVLRGELTFDPELTRTKDAQPSAERAHRVIDFLTANLQLSLDGRPLPIAFEVRELWVPGGATLGDLVVFSCPLPDRASDLRLFASESFEALVVSVQRVSSSGEVDTSSWLAERGAWTPVYRIGAGWQQPGWRPGGPEVFAGSAKAAGPAASDASREARRGSLAARFVRLGFEHILPSGIDHLLFIAGLVLGGARRYRRVLVSLTLFTLAHTLTLGLAQYEVLQVPPRFVEPLIALSIFLLGIDNLRPRAEPLDGRVGARHAVVFCCGLIHGLGFGNALRELSFDGAHALLALFSFNLGVELGQLAVVALLGLALLLIVERRTLERYATLAASAAIAASGLYLVFERLAPAGGASL